VRKRSFLWTTNVSTLGIVAFRRCYSPSPTSKTFSPRLKGCANAFFLCTALSSLKSLPSSVSFSSVPSSSVPFAGLVVASLRFFACEVLVFCWTILFLAAWARSFAACSARSCCSFCCCFCCCPDSAVGDGKRWRLSYRTWGCWAEERYLPLAKTFLPFGLFTEGFLPIGECEEWEPWFGKEREKDQDFLFPPSTCRNLKIL